MNSRHGDDSDPSSTQQNLATVSADFAAFQAQRLNAAHRRMRLSTQELVRAALIVDDLDDSTSSSELEIAVLAVRSAAATADLR